MAMFMGQPMGCKTNIKAGMTGRAVAARNGAINYEAFMNCPLCRLTDSCAGFNCPSPAVLSSHLISSFLFFARLSPNKYGSLIDRAFIELFNARHWKILKQSFPSSARVCLKVYLCGVSSIVNDTDTLRVRILR